MKSKSIFLTSVLLAALMMMFPVISRADGFGGGGGGGPYKQLEGNQSELLSEVWRSSRACESRISANTCLDLGLLFIGFEGPLPFDQL